jgi:Ala-tRNA(Pro) deacylase
MGIHCLEKQLKQGKLSFASDQRMMKYLGVTPGSVTPFGLINDVEHHVHVFIDQNITRSKTISFHPCINTASIVVEWEGFLKFLDFVTNKVDYISLYSNTSE